MNQKEYAAHLGVAPSRITALVQQGRIPKERDGSIDPAKADAALGKSLDRAKQAALRGALATPSGEAGGRTAETPPQASDGAPVGQFNRAKTVDATFVAKLRELEYRERIGGLIERDAYAKGCQDAAAAMAAELDNLVHRLAPVVAGESSISKCREIIAEEVFRARDTMANQLEALAADPRDGTRQ